MDGLRGNGMYALYCKENNCLLTLNVKAYIKDDLIMYSYELTNNVSDPTMWIARRVENAILAKNSVLSLHASTYSMPYHKFNPDNLIVVDLKISYTNIEMR